MSTKIHTAYVLRDRRQLWPVCRKIRERCERIVKRELTKLYRELIAGSQANYDEDTFKKYRYDDGRFTPLCASRFVQDQYADQIKQSGRNPFDLTVQVAIRQTKDGRILLIPYPGSGYLSGSLRFMARMPELRDYHYQNSSDRPKHISARAWAERARTWSPLLADSEWRHMLVLDIVSHSGWMYVCPATDMSLGKRRRGKR